MTRLRSPVTLWGLLVLQVFCTIFFVFDSVLDAMGLNEAPFARGTQIFEYAMTVMLLGSLVLTVLGLRELSRRHAQMEQQLQAAAGAFEAVMDKQFEEWRLTPSEADVARLAIKGLSVAEMAAVRGSKEGTIKAQSASVYRKAGVSGRLQLISLFVEDLMGAPGLASASPPVDHS
jgi:DNA-binding CsgD family transcriptional regulator